VRTTVGSWQQPTTEVIFAWQTRGQRLESAMLHRPFLDSLSVHVGGDGRHDRKCHDDSARMMWNPGAN
jgi:hypothetical protein